MAELTGLRHPPIANPPSFHVHCPMAIRLVGPLGTWILPDGETLIGRGERCGVRVLDPRLSREHARIRVTAQRALIEDLGSANGVLVNGDRVAGQMLLKPGDTIVCGPVLLAVQADEQRAPSGIRPPAGAPSPVTAAPVTAQRSTETMEPAAVARALAATAGGQRGAELHRGIATALAEADDHPARSGSTSIRPSEMVPAITTSALTPGPDRALAALAGPRNTTGILPSEAINDSADALIPDGGSQARPAISQRLLAGFIDPLAALAVGTVLGLGSAALGTVGALAWAGAGIVDGRAVLPGVPVAPIAELALLATHPSTWLHAGELARLVHGQEAPGPFILLFLSWAAGAVTLEITLLIGLVASTVLKGGPWCHRRYGLAIAVRRNGHHPGWVRATWRWTLLALLAPLAVITAAMGRRGLHDVLSGCEVRRR